MRKIHVQGLVMASMLAAACLGQARAATQESPETVRAEQGVVRAQKRLDAARKCDADPVPCAAAKRARLERAAKRADDNLAKFQASQAK